MKPTQHKPPACLECARPCWRDGHMSELHVRSPGDDGLAVSVCMYCGAAASVTLVDDTFTIRPLTPDEAERIDAAMEPVRFSFMRKRAMAAIFGGNLWDY